MAEALQKIYVQVAVALPVSGTFTYTVTDGLIEKAEVGKRVLISFSGRKVAGYILRIIPPKDREGLKDILNISDPYPLFPLDMVEFFEWLSNYYHYPIGLAIKTALPTGLNVNVPDGMGMPSKGWLDRVGLLKRVFITVKKGATVDRSLFDHKRAPGNEPEFLEMIIEKGEVSLREIKRAFKNGDYLVDKWVHKGFLKRSLRTVARDIAGETLLISPTPPPLNPTQKEVFEKIAGKLKENSFFTYLLHGVTASGKTEVYYHAVRVATELGRQSIIMVPEIALTVSLASLFKARFGDRVAVLHSALSLGERYDQWIRIAKGEADVVIGARSALFAPTSRLGLIIIDEEHDPSYKQEEKFRYQARDAAIVRAKLTNALVILGSGTPSIQSYQNAVSGRYGLLTMPERILKREPPDITIIDMTHFEGSPGARDDGIISPPLREAIGENLAQGKQIILFLNRRGFSALYLCRFCGEAIRCPNCEVSLTYHRYGNSLLCHYCGFRIHPPDRCPLCSRQNLKPYGFGTERVEETLRERFPEARVERMDRDTMRHKGKVQQVLRRFLDYETDILVGTQMITKGHDFPSVTLVGVISADLSLNWPDFRAGEITFQLLSQVAGRTGRGKSPGRVIIQTFNPSHYAIIAARDHDYQGFFSREIQLRRQLNYPPFSSIANLRLLGNSKSKTEKIAQQMGMKIDNILKKQSKGKGHMEVLGPVEAPMAKLKGKYRQQILVKSGSSKALNLLLKEVDKGSAPILSASGVRLIIDIDPYQMM
jgi:primosomal protein N' (replication factor Y)